MKEVSTASEFHTCIYINSSFDNKHLHLCSTRKSAPWCSSCTGGALFNIYGECLNATDSCTNASTSMSSHSILTSIPYQCSQQGSTPGWWGRSSLVTCCKLSHILKTSEPPSSSRLVSGLASTCTNNARLPDEDCVLVA